MAYMPGGKFKPVLQDFAGSRSKGIAKSPYLGVQYRLAPRCGSDLAIRAEHPAKSQRAFKPSGKRKEASRKVVVYIGLRCLRLGGGDLLERQVAVLGVHMDLIALAELALQHGHRQRVL